MGKARSRPAGGSRSPRFHRRPAGADAGGARRVTSGVRWRTRDPCLAGSPRPRYASMAVAPSRHPRESGETGRRAGLRIQWADRPLGVRLPTLAPLWSADDQHGASMKVDVEAIEGCKRRLAVEAPVDVVQQEIGRAHV